MTYEASAPDIIFQSTLPLRGATGLPDGHDAVVDISIHTPLAGSDVVMLNVVPDIRDFNPHSPCGERHTRPESGQDTQRFQSTLPLRGATAKMRHF